MHLLLRRAFSGNAGQPCPDHAWCPGASLIWPKVGYWLNPEYSNGSTTAAVTPPNVGRCLPPKDKRCPGYDNDGDEMRVTRAVGGDRFCSDAYEGYECRVCTPGYFSPSPNSACPTVQTIIAL